MGDKDKDKDRGKEQSTAEQQLLNLIEGDKKDEPGKQTAEQPGKPGEAQPAAGQGTGAVAQEPGSAAEELSQAIGPQPGAQAGQAAGQNPQAGAPPVKKRQVPVFSKDVIKGRLAFLQDSFIKDLFKGNLFKGKDVESLLDIVNYILIGVICMLFMFLGYEYISKEKTSDAVSDITSLKDNRKMKKEEIVSASLKGVEYYVGNVKRRDIFRPKPKEVKKKVVEKPRSVIDETLGDLKLVGFSPSSSGEENFAMIENTKSETTFFLTEGETIAGLKVKQVRPDRVVLTDGVETRELK